MPRNGFGDAATDGGRDVCTTASTKMTALLATSGACASSKKIFGEEKNNSKHEEYKGKDIRKIKNLKGNRIISNGNS